MLLNFVLTFVNQMQIRRFGKYYEKLY